MDLANYVKTTDVPGMLNSATVTKSANFTLSLDEAGKLVKCTKTSAQTVAVPANASVAFPVGTEIELVQYGAGKVTISAASGVTINAAGGAKKTASQYSCAVLKKIDTDEWLLAGGLTT